MQKQTPRLLLSGVICAYFGYGLVFHWDEGFAEIVKNLMMLAAGYWLGSSNGSFNKDERMVRGKSTD